MNRYFFAKGGSLFFSSVFLYVAHAMKEFALGNLELCLKHCSQAEIFIKSWCNETRLWHIINIIRGMLAYVQGDLLAAKEYFEQSGKIVNYLSDPSLLAWYYPLHIQLLSDLGLVIQQEELIEELLSLCNSRQLTFTKCSLVYEAIDFHLRLKHSDDASVLYENIKNELKLSNYSKNTHLFSNEAMLDSLFLGGKGELEQQQNILFGLAKEYEASGRVIQQLNCLVPLINSAIESKNIILAKEKLKKVVTIAASKGLVQLLAKLCPTAINFLAEWALSEWSPKRKSFMADVCHRFGTQNSDIPKSSFQIEALTQSEKNVMELLALGYSNKMIAEKLFVSINTIKFHLKVVFSKLGVSNRIQANLVYAQNKGMF